MLLRADIYLAAVASAADRLGSSFYVVSAGVRTLKQRPFHPGYADETTFF